MIDYMAKKKRPHDRHKKLLLPGRVSAELRQVLQDYADQQRRSLAQAVELLLEEVMATKGLWPPSAHPGT